MKHAQRITVFEVKNFNTFKTRVYLYKLQRKAMHSKLVSYKNYIFVFFNFFLAKEIQCVVTPLHPNFSVLQ